VKLGLPPGHPLPWLLTDGRTARSGPIGDQLWVRIHDVEAALSARRYASPGRLVIDVDDQDDHTGGRYLLEVDDSGAARCRRMDAQPDTEPDLSLRVNDLAGLWLGGGESTPTVATLVSIGRATVRDDATAARAHALFSWPVPPWAVTHF
jgi:predicted acetyltransferase